MNVLPKDPNTGSAHGTPPSDDDAEVRRRLVAAYGGILRRVLSWAFDPVPPPSDLGPRLHQLSANGTVVHVTRSASFVTFLFFQHLFLRLGVSMAMAVSGLASRVWKPWGRLVAGRRIARAPYGDDVAGAVREGHDALVFLRPSSSLFANVTGRRNVDPFPALVKLQRTLGRPIYLVPQLVMWERSPPRLRRNLLDVLFGEPERPGLWRSLFSFLRNRNRAFVRTGDPLDLRAYVEENAALDDELIARKIRGMLSQHLSREMRVVTGPPLKSPERLVLETLRDRSLRATIAEVARERGRADGSVEREAESAVREIAARYSPLAIDIARLVLSWVFNRIYDGIEVDEEGLAEVGRTNARSPIVVCPSHKSHIDYLILSYVFYVRGLIPPHIAAGNNLDFFPLGAVFRKCGAFFIRRTFRGDRVYSAALRAYIRKLLRDGFSQEFFVEGTRSRSGKLLLPRFGMLGMEVEAWIDGARSDIAFAPTWIGYARIIEERSYEAELGGEEKRKEDLASLITAPKVLVSRYGRIHLRFDKPVSLQELATQRGFDRENHTEEQKRDLIRALGFRIVEGINRAAVLTPTALLCTVLLSQDDEGLTAEEIADRAGFLARQVQENGGVTSFPPDPEELDPAGSGHLGEACAALLRDKSIVTSGSGAGRRFSVARPRRLRLDYYKNVAIHYFVADALLATALFTSTERSESAVARRTLCISRHLKNEFIYGAGTFEQIFSACVHRLVSHGLLSRRPSEDGSEAVLEVTELGGVRLRQLASLVKNFVESYILATEALLLLQDGPRDTRDWMKATLERGRAELAAGRIRRVESLSKANIDSAFQFFESIGLIERTGDKGRARKLTAGTTSDVVRSRVEELRSFLLA